MLYTRPHGSKQSTSAVEHSDARLSWRKDGAQIIPQAKCDQWPPQLEWVNWRFLLSALAVQQKYNQDRGERHVPIHSGRVSDQHGGAGLRLRGCCSEPESIFAHGRCKGAGEGYCGGSWFVELRVDVGWCGAGEAFSYLLAYQARLGAP
jgi:hypothetical protein